MRLLGTFARPDLAIDVGTAVTRLCAKSSVVLERESFVRDQLGEQQLRRAALRRGVVCDIAAAAEVIEPMLAKFGPHRERPGVLVCTPSDALRTEREALVEAVTEAGATVVRVVPEPLAAAIGSGLDVSGEQARMIADIGDGVTDIAVLARGGVLHSEAIRTGCSDIRRTITEWLEWHHGLVIDHDEAHSILLDFCNAARRAQFEIGGAIAGRRALLHFRRDDLGAVIEPAIDTIAFFVATMFRRLPENVAAEILQSGMMIAGGGAKLDLLVERIERATGLTTDRPSDPLHCVIAGARSMLSSVALPEETLV